MTNRSLSDSARDRQLVVFVRTNAFNPPVVEDQDSLVLEVAGEGVDITHRLEGRWVRTSLFLQPDGTIHREQKDV